ncbi:DHA2 family efflux MFS transporter permease subunit [Streptomyces sp. NPDC057545]|uniref:DHA2 family efflux MFS transporter permease subunit n=1 Tax=Streptomyces sp. NPDC057545 TaxID=3346164 RepID=UPI00369DDCA5
MKKAVPTSAGAPPGAPDNDERITPALWGLSSILTLGGVMSMFTSTVVNVALGTVGEKLNAPLGTVQWIATGYLIALAAAIPMSGWASRRYGAARLWLVCVALFAVFSTLCAMATSIEMLIAFRVLQGLSGGLLVPAGQILFATAAGPKRLGRMMSVLSIPIYLAPVLGTLGGSLLTDRLGWPWLFLVNVPIAVVSLATGWRWLPRETPRDDQPLDWPGLALSMVGLPLLVYGVAQIGEHGNADALALGSVIAGALLLTVFAVHALRARKPLLNLRLFADSAFSSAAVVIFCMGVALFGAMIVLPVYYLDVRHESLVDTGLLTAPLALGTVAALPLAGKLTDRIGGARVILAGLIVTVIGTVPLALITEHDSYWWLSAVQVVRGCGIGLTTTPALATGLVMVPKEQIPHAMPIFNMLQRIGGSFGTSILTALLAYRMTTGPDTAAGTAAAIGSTHWWITGITAIVLIPSVILVRIESARRRETAAAATA